MALGHGRVPPLRLRSLQLFSYQLPLQSSGLLPSKGNLFRVFFQLVAISTDTNSDPEGSDLANMQRSVFVIIASDGSASAFLASRELGPMPEPLDAKRSLTYIEGTPPRRTLQSWMAWVTGSPLPWEPFFPDGTGLGPRQLQGRRRDHLLLESNQPRGDLPQVGRDYSTLRWQDLQTVSSPSHGMGHLRGIFIRKSANSWAYWKALIGWTLVNLPSLPD